MTDTVTDTTLTVSVPPNTSVVLPGGYVTSEGTLTRSAEVRELTGYDEEKISAAVTTSQALDTILHLATTKVGDEEPEQMTWATLLAGDADAILLKIRDVNFGGSVPIDYTCGSCNHEGHSDLDLLKDIPSYTISENERVFDVELSGGRKVRCALPTYALRQQIAQEYEDGKNGAEIATTLLSGCVLEDLSTSFPITSKIAFVRELSIPDRVELLKQVDKRKVGPDLLDGSLICEGCGEKVKVALAMSDLFRWS